MIYPSWNIIKEHLKWGNFPLYILSLSLSLSLSKDQSLYETAVSLSVTPEKSLYIILYGSPLSRLSTHTHNYCFLSSRVKNIDATKFNTVSFYMEGHSRYIYVLCVYFPGPSDKCVIEGNDCTIVSDLSKITLQKNTDTSGECIYCIRFNLFF